MKINIGAHNHDELIAWSHRSKPRNAQQKNLVCYEQTINCQDTSLVGQAHKSMKANEHHGE